MGQEPLGVAQLRVPGPHLEPSMGALFPTDEDLLTAVRRGQEVAVESLVERLDCIWAMVRKCERHVGASLDAEERLEAVQESLVAIWSKLDRYRSPTPLEAWVWGFVVREVYKCLRNRRLGAEQVPPELASKEAVSAYDAEFYERVAGCLVEIGSPYTEIIRLRHFEQRTFSQIGVKLAMPPSSVKARYYRALQRLRVLMQPLWREIVG